MATKRRDPVAVLRKAAQRIRARRAALALSQERVAAQAGMSVRHYQKIEAGAVNVRLTSLVSIARALGLSVGDISD